MTGVYNIVSKKRDILILEFHLNYSDWKRRGGGGREEGKGGGGGVLKSHISRK